MDERRGARPAARRRALSRRLYAGEPADRPPWLEERLLRPGEVALLFQVSRRTVADWAASGLLPTVVTTPGGHRRFRERDVRTLIERLTKERTAPRGRRFPTSG